MGISRQGQTTYLQTLPSIKSLSEILNLTCISSLVNFEADEFENILVKRRTPAWTRFYCCLRVLRCKEHSDRGNKWVVSVKRSENVESEVKEHLKSKNLPLSPSLSLSLSLPLISKQNEIFPILSERIILSTLMTWLFPKKISLEKYFPITFSLQF